MANVLLDTTFLLPTLGFQVEEIQAKDFETLRSASASGTKLCCSQISFVEILGKLAKVKSAVNLEIVEEGIRSLLESGIYEWVDASSEALRHAFKLRLKGHTDNIDNILYSIACTSDNMLFLSLDRQLKAFLAKNGFNEKIVITTKDLVPAN